MTGDTTSAKMTNKPPDKPSLSKSGCKMPPDSGARVLVFRRRPTAPSPPAGLVPDLGRYQRADHPDDYRHRMLVNLAAFIFVLGLGAAGFWLADTLAHIRKNQDCALSGRRGCNLVPFVHQNRW